MLTERDVTEAEALLDPEKILEMRRSQGWSQEEMARRLGVRAAAVRNWEHGRRRPGGMAAIRLVSLMGGIR